MTSSINITFLGTGSATQSSTRNQSALALRLNADVWIFDCGEATLRQIQKSSVKMGRIQKIFITHTHGDHIFGLVPLLSSRLNGAGGLAQGQEDPRTRVDMTQQHIEIYGPSGTRAYVRAGLIYTHTLLDSPYVVHELHTPSDSQDNGSNLPIHPAESPLGRDIPLVDGVWTDIYKDGTFSVSAAPILHSVPCIGYVVNEALVPGKVDPRDYIPHIKRTNTPMSVMRQLQKGESVTLVDGTVLHGPEPRKGRKIAILGDTYDPSPILPLANGVDILVHEATNAHLPGTDPLTKDSDTYESVEARAKSRGHSTPQMAGAFARRTNAKKLILNHFSSRYSDTQSDEGKKIMSSIAELAAREYSGDVICAEDLMSIDIDLEPVV